MTFQATIETLLQRTGASRTTLRLDRPEGFFPVVAEALAPGIRTIADDTSIDLRASATFRSLERDRRLLIPAPACYFFRDSLCTVCFRSLRQNFFNSRRSVPRVSFGVR